MNKTKIEWCDYTINPVKGLCPKACSYCYARAMYKRFKWNPEIRYDPDAFKGLPSKPSRVFVGSTIDLFGQWVERDWWHMIMAKCLSRSQHTFMFLTKYPQNLPKKFPDNCDVGVTATNIHDLKSATIYLTGISAKVKYISLEPFLSLGIDDGELELLESYWLKNRIDWLIIGAQTKPTVMPKIEWVKEIVDAADKAGVKVFLKDSLNPMFAENDCKLFIEYRDKLFTFKDFGQEGKTSWHLRQEMPG